MTWDRGPEHGVRAVRSVWQPPRSPGIRTFPETCRLDDHMHCCTIRAPINVYHPEYGFWCC